MASFIVEIENTSNAPGSRGFAWKIFEAANAAEANAKANQGLGANERAGITLPNSDEGFRRLRVSSPPFAARYGPGGYISFVENTPGANIGDINGGGDPPPRDMGSGNQGLTGPILGSEDLLHRGRLILANLQMRIGQQQKNLINSKGLHSKTM